MKISSLQLFSKYFIPLRWIFFYKIQEVRETNANKNPMEPHSLRQLNFPPSAGNVKQRMRIDSCCLLSLVHICRLSPWGYYLFSPHPIPCWQTCLWYSKEELQVCLKFRSNEELPFRLVFFPQTWPTIGRDGKEAGLSLAGSLQFHWASAAWTYSAQQ